MSKKAGDGKPSLRVVGSNDNADPLFADYGLAAGGPKHGAGRVNTAAAARTNAFAKLPLGWTTKAAKATKSPATLVLAYLLYCAWRAKKPTFALPNKWLEQREVSRDVKRRVLRDLEKAGLITVKRSDRKSPIVTLVVR